MFRFVSLEAGMAVPFAFSVPHRSESVSNES